VSNYASLQADYAKVFPAYHRLAECIHRLLRSRLDAAGLRLAEVSARPKDPASFVKKALRKGYDDPMAQIGDKAGARIVVPFARDREAVLEACREVLELGKPEDKREELGSDRVGYLGLHYAVGVRTDVLEPQQADLAGLKAELQIHTKAESAWATAAHDSLYKAVVPVPELVARRLNRLSSLAEIFDDEVERFLVELASQPGFAELEALLPPLDAMLLKFTPRGGDQGLSAIIIPVLRPLFDEDEPEKIISEHIGPYIDKHESDIAALYARYADDDRANPLLYQPEAILLFERLESNPYSLRPAWPPTIEVELLENLALLRGVLLN
jgi:ppGpp synthetase/RelA/SpoT-type nucleotidyltranferase